MGETQTRQFEVDGMTCASCALRVERILERQPGVSEAVVNFDAEGVIMGTPQYMSPEQARDERSRIGPHTDVWGVAVVWYECLTACVPFDGESAVEVLTAVCQAPIDFEAVPEAYVPLLGDALGRTPELRIRTLSELKARIEQMGIARSSVPPAPASLSSWPPTSEESEGQLAPVGLGPEEFGSAAPATTQVDSELLTIPVRSNRSVLLAGLALAMAVALAAWWTVGLPGEEAAPLKEPAIAEPDVLREIAEPIPLPAATVEEIAPETSGEIPPEASEEIAAETVEGIPPETSGEIPPETVDEVAPETVDEVAPEPEPEVVKTQPVTPRRKYRPEHRQKRPVSGGSQPGSPPDLVTEW